MRRLHGWVVPGTVAFLALAWAAPASGQASLSLLGDMDCFGTGAACVEGATLPGGYAAVTYTAADPVFTDRWRWGGSPAWEHTFTPTPFDAFLRFRTAGIADISGPYSVFVDGLLVGTLPYDGYSHVLVETFVFPLSSALVSDGVARVAIPSIGGADGWAIDYSEIYTRAAVPEPGTILLLATGLAGLGLLAYRRRERFG